MMTSHPSEREIQQYALDKPGCTKTLIEHIESCEHCRAGVTTYQLLFSEIKQQPNPAFDFDLSALVLPHLPSSPPRLSADRFIAGFLVFFICCCVGIPIFLFRQYLLNMFSGVSSFFIYSIICSAVIIVLFKTLDMYKKYQKQMQLLNFH
jgi:hypothetical protein